MRTYLVAMTKGRTDRASAVCVDDGDAESAAELKVFRTRYASHELKRVGYDEMRKLMTAV